MATTTKKNPLDFFGQTLAEAEGHHTAEMFTHYLDEIFFAATQDLEIEAVMILRKGDDVALLGVRNGKIIKSTGGFHEVILPVIQRI